MSISPPKDIILAVDISRSMIGFGNHGEKTNDIFDSVKSKLTDYVNSLKLHDTLTVITFGSEVFAYPTISITTEEDIDKALSLISSLRANQQKTYTALMLHNLNEKLAELSKEAVGRLQLAVIMTDAIDDPPYGKEHAISAELGNQISNEGDDRFIYYISLNPEINQSIKGIVNAFFPDATLHNANNDHSLTQLTDQVLENLVPVVTIEPSEEMSLQYKPFDEKEFEVHIIANKLAAGIPLEFQLKYETEDAFLTSETKQINLVEGDNKFTIKSTLPVRYEGSYTANLDVKLLSDLNYLVKPSPEVPLTVNAESLSFSEKMKNLPEYYVPLGLILLILVIAGYKVFKYMTFKPLFELVFWETTEEESNLNMKKKIPDFDPFSFNAIYKSFDLIENEIKKFVVSSNIDSNPDIFLEQLPVADTFSFHTVGPTRKRKMYIDKKDKRKIKIKKNFTGKFVKNMSYFRYGNYSFAIKTNIVA